MSEPSPEAVDAESRAAVRLLAGIVAVAMAMWCLLGWFVVTPDSPITGWGRSKQDTSIVARGARRLYAAEHAARTFDRDVAHPGKPMVYIIGSSITREAIDVDLLQERLSATFGVEKYAIDRGAPFFTWAMADRLTLRPHDRVITSIAIDNFRKDWLQTHNGLHPYLNFLPRPRHILSVGEMPVAERLDYALAGAPPHRALRDLPAFRNGLQAGLGWLAGGPKPKVTPPMNVTGKDVIRHFRDQERWDALTISASDLGLAPGYINHDSLLALHRDVRDAGAELWTLYLPPSPEYGPRYLTEDLVPGFHAYWHAATPPYLVMPGLPQDHHTDYRHLNNDGRAQMTEAVAQMLLQTPLGATPSAPAVLAPRDAAATDALEVLRRERPQKAGGRRPPPSAED